MFLFLLFSLIAGGTKLALGSTPFELPLTIAATGKLLIDIKVNNQPVTCIIDTGSPAFLLLDQDIAEKQKLVKNPMHTKLRFFAEEYGGTTYEVTLPKVEIGPLHFEEVKALTIDNVHRATGLGYMNLPNFWAQGIVGMGFLENFRVKIDYPHHTLLLFPPENPFKPPLFSRIAPIIPVGPSGKTIPFLLDTGSTFSIVSEKVMDRLGLSYLSLGSGKQDPLFRGIAHADSINIGPVAYKDITLEVAGNFEQYAGTETISGIIGYDFLKDFILDIDFPRESLIIQKP